MKVVHITPSYFGQSSIIGGGERYSYELARYMARRCDTTLVSFGEEYAEYQDGALKVKIYPVAAYLHQSIVDPVPANLRWVEEIKQADIVHLHQQRVDITGLAVQYARYYGRQIFITDLGSGGNDLLEKLHLAEEISGWLPISKFASRFIGSALHGRNAIIYGGVDTDFFQPPVDAAVRQPNRVCYVGRLLPHKGIDTLVEAVTPDMELHLVGRPYNPAYFAYLQELAEGKNVHFILEASDQKIREEYQAARVSVLGSVYTDVYGQNYARPELLGLVLLEAQSCGTPVVTTRVASMPEVVDAGRTGLIVEPNNPAEMRSALQQLLDLAEPAYREMSLAARQWVESRFTWLAVVERCLHSYTSAFAYRDIPAPWLDDAVHRASPAYNDSTHHEVVNRLNEIQNFKSGGRLLEVGSSSGLLLKMAGEVDFETCGWTPTQAEAEAASALAGCPVIHGQLAGQSFATASFDVITVAAGFDMENLAASLKHFCDWLKPGGLVVVDVPQNEAASDGLYSEDALDSLFRITGFLPVQREYMPVKDKAEKVDRVRFFLLVPDQPVPSEGCDYLFISNLYPPHYIGGYEVICEDTFNAFENVGATSLILTGRYGLAEPAVQGNILRLLAADITHYQGEELRISDDTNGELNAAIVRECIRQFKPKKVILFNLFGLNTLAILTALEELHVPRLMHLCDYQLIPYWNPSLKNFDKLKTKLLHPEMRLTALSRLIADFYTTHGFPAQSLQVIYYSMPLKLLEGVQVHQPGKANYSINEPFKVLYAGRFNDAKGTLLAVEAFIILVEKYQAFASLDLIGDGDLTYIARIKQLVKAAEDRLGVSLRVYWRGFKPRTEVIQVMHDYDAFVLSSTTIRPEPFGLVVMEAMTVGVPVVVSDSAGASEIVEDGLTGLLANTDDAASFAAALWQLYQDPELGQRLSQQGRQTILDNHAGPQMADKFLI